MTPVCLWTVRTDRPITPGYDSILAPDEESRAQRFRFPQDQQRYRIVRTALRRLLGQALDCDPATVEFSYSAKGKPSLARPDRQIYFNLSHSGDYGLIGIAEDHLIGVDLELMEPKSNFLALAQRFFAPSESLCLRAKSAAEQRQIFYQLWTAKEAFLKATGLGISAGLDRVIMSKSLQCYASLPELYQPENWQLLSQPFFDNYWGAIALNSPNNDLDFVAIKAFDWQSDYHG